MVRVRKTNKKQKVRVVAKKATPSQKNEVTALGKIIRSLGGLGGGALGSMVGMPSTGSSLGTGLGAAVSRWLGQGDYTVSSNSIVQKASAGIPMMHKEGQSIIVRHREFVRSIAPSTAFTVQASLEINPGIDTTFPWLSSIARQFEQYTIKGMVYHYVPTSGITISGPDSSMGSVMIYTTYRVSDRAPGSKIELLNEYWSNECRPDMELVHPIECNPSENPFNIHYVRSLTAVGEPLMYDMGKTYVCTQGQQGTTGLIGDLWVTYEIELKKPIVSSNATDDSAYFKGVGAVGSYTACFANVGGVWGALRPTFTNNTINFPPNVVGSYDVFVELSGSGVNITAASAWNTTPTVVNCTLASGNLLTAEGTLVTAATSVNNIYYRFRVQALSSHLAATATIPTPTVTTGGGTILCAVFIYFYPISSAIETAEPVSKLPTVWM